MEIARVDERCLTPGTRLNRVYQIDQVLSSSELSNVYLCSRLTGEERCVVKEFFPKALAMRDLDNQTALCRLPSARGKYEQMMQEFLQEARIMKELSHPNIVTCIDHFAENGTSYIVMSYCEGKTLDCYLETGIPADFFRQTVLPLIDALQICHRAGVIHRDIKPSNIMVDHDGTPTLLDFGSAIYVKDGCAKPIRTTRGFSPLELYSEKSEQGVYSDIYSFAATLYACFTGKPPADVTERIIEDRIEHVRQGKERISLPLSWLIMRGLSLSHQKRCSSLTVFRLACYLEHLLSRMRKKDKQLTASSVNQEG